MRLKQFIDGIQFDYENGALMTLKATVDDASGAKFISYQLRMLQENHIPKLLSMVAEEVNGIPILRYDITMKRRLIQMMLIEPPDSDQVIELGYQLVKAISDCKEYMLSENGFVLHEDLLFVGRGLFDLQLIYLPVEGIRKRPVTEELRTILLRLMSMVQGPIPKQWTALMGVLSQEPYSLQHLKHVLKQIRLKEPLKDIVEASSTTQTRKSWKWGQIWCKLKLPSKLKLSKQQNKRIQKTQNKSDSPSNIKANLHAKIPPPLSGKTEVLAKPAAIDQMPIRFVFLCNGENQHYVMTEANFLIGRNHSGVHYSDSSDGVSRIHCEISKTDAGLEVKDLGSLNGTSLNGEQLVPYKSYPFKFGDVLQVVQTQVRLENEPRSRIHA